MRPPGLYSPWNSPGQNTGAFPFSRGSSQSPGIEPRSPTLQEDSLPAKPQGKPTSLPGLYQKETGRSPVLGLWITRSPNKSLHLDLAFDMKAPYLCSVSGQAPHEEPSCSSANTLVAHVAHSVASRGLGRTRTSHTRPWSVPREEGRGWRLRAEEEG